MKSGVLPAIKPLIEGQVRDTIVCRGGDGNFYLTGSTGASLWVCNRVVQVWNSSDLIKWRYLALVSDLDKKGTWEKNWRPLHDKPCRAIWPPEFDYVRGNHYICLSIAPTRISILKSTTEKPEESYVYAFSLEKPIIKTIDPTLFEDDDGKVYLTSASTTRIARVKDDLPGLADDFHSVTLPDADHAPSHHAAKCTGRGSNDLGTEATVLFKANDRYYLGAAEEREVRYSACLGTSDHIYCPRRMRYEAVPCAEGTGFFQGHIGGWWTSVFGNQTQSSFREKPAMVRVDFGWQGKVIRSFLRIWWLRYANARRGRA